MGRKLPTLLGVLACFLGLTMNLWSQSNLPVKGIRGYLDPRTGLFHSLPQAALPDAEVPPPAPFGGKFVFNFTITVDSAIASTAKIICEATASTEDVASLNLILETASVTATRSGSTATCTVTIPYSWNLSSATTDKVSLTYQIFAGPSSTTNPLATRVSEQNLKTISVPANGATTTETITATI
jgi:hypothetical protein